MPTIISSSWASATPVPRQHLIQKVCRLFGFSDADTDLVQVALDNLDDTINDMNTALFDFNKVMESGIALTAAQPYVVASNTFYREAIAYLVATSNGASQVPLDYIPWTEYQRWYGDDTIQGSTARYSLFNFEQEGRIYLNPTPDASTVAAYTLTVESYRRIPAISTLGANDSLNVPREIESALIYGAHKRMAIHILGAGHKDVAALANLELQALERLKRVDKTHPDEKKRFILGDFAKRGGRNRVNTNVYVKI